MIPVFARLDVRARLALAWSVLIGLAVLIALPVILAATNLAGNWQRQAVLHREVSVLSQRVLSHFDEVSAWYAAHDETEDSLFQYSAPDQARQAFDADLDRLAQALVEAGAHLRQTPSSALVPLDNTVSELVGEIGFSGAFSDVLRAFIALEGSDIRLSGLTIEALPGQPAGRVRGHVELRQAYLTVTDDES
jgi:type II secretory pathway pseudopilin PulG